VFFAGRTEEALAGLSRYYEERVRMDRRIRSALLYPAVMLGLMLVVIAVLLVKVLPIFDDVYASLGGQLTGIAGGLLNLGRWLDRAMPVLWVLLVAAAAFFAAFALAEPFRAKLTGAWSKSRGDKGISRKMNTARLAQAMSMGMASGLPMEEAVELAAGLMEDVPPAKARCLDCRARLDQGAPLSHAMKDSGLLPAGPCRLLELGQRSCSGDLAMAKIAGDLTEEGEAVTVVGCIPCAAPGERLVASGVWEQHPQHGEQLRASELERSLPEDEEEIVSYLPSGVLKGVGPATARNMVDRFGLETFDILETAPERLTCLRGVTDRRAREIGEEFRRHMGLRRLMAFLARYELPPVLAMSLRRQYGDAALEKLREDPYLLAGDDCGVAFSVADEIAMSMGFQPDSGQRLQAAVSFELSHNENNGHVFLPRGKLISATAQLLQCEEEGPERALDALIDRGLVVQERVADVCVCCGRPAKHSILWGVAY